jgi:hypothetical protein
MKQAIFILIVCCCVPASGQGHTDSTGSGLWINPTWPWAAAQLVPSPEWYLNKDKTTDFGLRWQLTPVLYSFGLNPHVSPWRALVADPLARYNGSAEIYISPEYIPDLQNNWRIRGGVRTYVPLHQYGEYLAGSLGISYFQDTQQDGFSYEAGMYIFFGILGLQVNYTPGSLRSEWLFTINIRYF